MTTLIELHVWLKLAAGLLLLVAVAYVLFVVGVWVYAACDVVRTIWKARRR